MSAKRDKTTEERLIEDRDRLEAAMRKATPGQLPALVKQHLEVLAALDKIAKPQKGSVRDQLAEKRKARKSPARRARAAGTAQT